jgi:hypothetical protein
LTDDDLGPDAANGLDRRPGCAARVGLAVLLLAIALVAAWGMMRTSITPIRPDQAAPKGHVQSQCAACHALSADAEPVEVDRSAP